MWFERGVACRSGSSVPHDVLDCPLQMSLYIQAQYKALKAVYKGEIAKAEANLSVYFKNSVGVGEHADIVEVMDEQLDKLAQAKDKLEALEDLML